MREDGRADLSRAAVFHAVRSRYHTYMSERRSKIEEAGIQKAPVVFHLRFGIDIDGTITQAPSHFKRLIDSLMSTHNHVFIITARDEGRRDETEELLELLGIRFDKLVMKPIEWPGTVPEWKVKAVRGTNIQLMFDDEDANCWAIQQQTTCLAAHMLPIPELQQEFVALLEEHDRRKAMRELQVRGIEVGTKT